MSWLSKYLPLLSGCESPWRVGFGCCCVLYCWGNVNLNVYWSQTHFLCYSHTSQCLMHFLVDLCFCFSTVDSIPMMCLASHHSAFELMMPPKPSFVYISGQSCSFRRIARCSSSLMSPLLCYFAPPHLISVRVSPSFQVSTHSDVWILRTVDSSIWCLLELERHFWSFHQLETISSAGQINLYLNWDLWCAGLTSAALEKSENLEGTLQTGRCSN